MTDKISESTIKQAVKRRRDDILSNLDTMTLKKCRRQLEDDLGLEQDALKPYKDLLSKLIDKVIATANSATAAVKPGVPRGKAKPDSQKAKSSNKDMAGDGAEKAAQKAAGSRQYSKLVGKLRQMCKEATIPIPPNVYIKNKTNAELEAAIAELLEKQGLSANSGKDEVARVKKQLTLQRDLDGIDTSNIIAEGGRRRRQAATAPVNYRQMMEESDDGSEDESDIKESCSGSESGLGSDADEDVHGSKDEAQTSEDLAEVSQASETKAERSVKEAHVMQAQSPDENKPSLNGQGGKVSQKRATAAASELDESSDDDMQQDAKKPRAVLADWSDDD